MKHQTRRVLSRLLSLALALGLLSGTSLTAKADGHTHDFEYSASGDTITATCKNEGCSLTENKVTLTIDDPTNIYYDDKTSSHEFTLAGLDEFNSATGKTISASDIVYYKGDNQSQDIKNNTVKGATYKARLKVKDADDNTYSEAVPTNAGNYTVKAVVAETSNYNSGEATADFTIAKADAAVTSAPAARSLTYTGSAQALVTAGTTTTDCTMQYTLGTDATTAPTENWGETIPTAANVGTYYVWYKVVGGANHNDSASACVTTVISPAPSYDDDDDSYVAPAVRITEQEVPLADASAVVTPFADVPADAYYADAVAWAYANDITAGVSEQAFGPGATCSRGQMVTFLWRAAGCPEPTGTASAFSDVAAGSYYEKAVAWAVENGITDGVGDGKIDPDAIIDRAQAVTFLYRANGSPATAAADRFTDVSSDAYYADAVDWAVANGITDGVGNNAFAPDTNCNRGQTVTFLYRVYSETKA